MPAYAFLDRDGTLVREHADEDWRGRTDLELLPGVGPALWALREAGLLLVVVTNQYLIGEGYLTPGEYDQQTRSLTEALAVGGVVLDDVLHCPHARAAGCGCCKPATGLVDEAVRRHGVVDRPRSFVVGDSWSDMALAGAVGLRGFLVGRSGPGEPGVVGIGGVEAVPRLLGCSLPDQRGPG